MGCFVLVADGRREQQRRKAHNNTATATMTLEKQLFFHLFTKQYATCIGYHCYSSSLSRLVSTKTHQKNKTCRKKQTKGPAVMMTHPIPPVPHYHSIHPFIPSHASHQHSRISFRPAVHRHHLMSTDETGSFPPPKKSSNMTRRSSPSTSSFSASQARSDGPEE